MPGIQHRIGLPDTCSRPGERWSCAVCAQHPGRFAPGLAESQPLNAQAPAAAHSQFSSCIPAVCHQSAGHVRDVQQASSPGPHPLIANSCRRPGKSWSCPLCVARRWSSPRCRPRDAASLSRQAHAAASLACSPPCPGTASPTPVHAFMLWQADNAACGVWPRQSRRNIPELYTPHWRGWCRGLTPCCWWEPERTAGRPEGGTRAAIDMAAFGTRHRWSRIQASTSDAQHLRPHRVWSSRTHVRVDQGPSLRPSTATGR